MVISGELPDGGKLEIDVDSNGEYAYRSTPPEE